MNIDQEFIEYVVKSLVGKPEAVVVDRRIDEKGVLLELTVDPEDLGRVIGKRGATAQSLRTLLRALGTKNDARYNLKIVDNGIGGHAYSDDHPRANSASGPVSAPSSQASDDGSSDAPVTDVKEDEAPVVTSQPETSDRLRKAREELADLDDLDV
jgi:predicted RNA-binding protein YlqC (UPF0109 family)